MYIQKYVLNIIPQYLFELILADILYKYLEANEEIIVKEGKFEKLEKVLKVQKEIDLAKNDLFKNSKEK